MNFVDPHNPYPLEGFNQLGFLKPLIEDAQIIVGDYTYYDDPEGPEHFAQKNVLYKFDFVGDKLIIGKFCAIGKGVKFILNGANHAMGGFSTYPFNIFGHGWEKGFDPQTWQDTNKGNIEVGNDVWIGTEAVIMPGVKIGDGAIIGSYSVVASDVAPFAIVAGNPARQIKLRFESEIITQLLAIKWWDWRIEKITANINHIRGADIGALSSAMEI